MEDKISDLVQLLNKFAKYGQYRFEFREKIKKETTIKTGEYSAECYYRDFRDSSGKRINRVYQEWEGDLNDKNKQYFIDNFYNQLLINIILLKTSSSLVDLQGNPIVTINTQDLLKEGYLPTNTN